MSGPDCSVLCCPDLPSCSCEDCIACLPDDGNDDEDETESMIRWPSQRFWSPPYRWLHLKLEMTDGREVMMT